MARAFGFRWFKSMVSEGWRLQHRLVPLDGPAAFIGLERVVGRIHHFHGALKSITWLSVDLRKGDAIHHQIVLTLRREVLLPKDQRLIDSRMV